MTDSGHTTVAFAAATVFAMEYREYRAVLLGMSGVIFFLIGKINMLGMHDLLLNLLIGISSVRLN